jgi:hypothetical protein
MTTLQDPLVRGLHRETPDFGRKAGDDKVSRPTVFEGPRPYHTYRGVKGSYGSDALDSARFVQDRIDSPVNHFSDVDFSFLSCELLYGGSSTAQVEHIRFHI